ncbi:MAG: alpha/beta hydrolase [Antricoccus sp.]
MTSNHRQFRGQAAFDPLGPTVLTATTPTGRVLHYIDDGDPGWTTVVFFGGAATTVRAFGLLEFAGTFRRELEVRVISVERNGLGQTVFDIDYSPADYAADVIWLLDQLGVASYSLIAISGGGPYAAEVAARAPKRIRSVHLACAYAERIDTDAPRAITEQDARAIASNPVSWWRYPEQSPVHQIPGFVDSTYEEATREFFVRGQLGDPAPLIHAAGIRDRPLPDLSDVTAPTFLYWGTEDSLVPVRQMEHWASLLPNITVRRLYNGEGHDIQYRHWDQIIVDIATLTDHQLVSSDDQTCLLDDNEAAALLAAGGWLGLRAWAPQV